MAIITGIVPSSEKPGHVDILVDGVLFATVPAREVAELSLKEGATAREPEPEPARGEKPGAAGKTYERALSLLSFRGRSVKELRKRLHEKGESAEQIAPTIERLQQSGLLDDARFAAERARAGVVGKARSRRQIEHDLVQRGVTREVAADAFRQVLEDEGTSELAVTVRAARKKMKTLERLDPQAQRQKLYAFLARQGHSPDLVRRALREVLDAAPPEGAEEAGE
jgi:regulatory protein